MKIVSILTLSAFLSFQAASQDNGWHLKSADVDGSVGIAAENIYSQLKGKTAQTVVVAVIDSGIDVEHEDLKDNVWINTDEIPDNGIDDDKNGYVDDVYGWNFIGGKNGNVNDDTYEVTRLYGKYHYKFKDADRNKLSKSDKKDYDVYMKCKEEVEKERSKATENVKRYESSKDNVTNGLAAITEALGENEPTLENLQAIEANEENEMLTIGKNILLDQIAQGSQIESIDAVKASIMEQIDGALDWFNGKLKYAYNTEFDTREIVGDNYADQTEMYYGNNDVEGPDALHGTHVAGIIGAVRGNDIGMDGVAENVKLMSVRTVPNGDERDKDVANAIRYAVDNGASIINMSFGKGYSWEEKVVEDAIKYAADNDVLLVHAAGNSSQDNDTTDNFPNDMYKKKKFLGIFGGKEKTFDNWMEIGALNYKNGQDLSAPFSNYGTKNVDLFAPGMAIYATIPDDQYRPLQGTSMAAPVVAGVAAILRSYYPTLSAVQVKNILMSTVTKMNNTVVLPGTKDEMVPFSKLSVAGGVVNAEKALKLAKVTKGSRKMKTKKGKA